MTTLHKTFNDTYFTSTEDLWDIGIDTSQPTNQDINNNYITDFSPTQQNYTTTLQQDYMIDYTNITDFENDDLDGFTFDPPLQPDIKQLPLEYFPEQEELEGYTLIKQIGEGAFAKVFKAIPNQNGHKAYLLQHYKEVAIKVARKELPKEQSNVDGSGTKGRYYCPQHNRYHHHRHRHMEKYMKKPKHKNLKSTTWEEIQAEIAIHKVVSNGSNHIVNFIDFQESHSYYFMVLERVNGGEVFDQVLKYTYLSEDLTRHIIHQLGLAVKHLHQVGVVHRDIKLENILYESIDFVPSDNKTQHYRKSDNKDTKLDEGKFIKGKGGAGIGLIKLTDFGLSKRIFTNTTATPCGTLGYTAPEVISQDHYSMKVDSWGIGCVLYTLLCGFPPFYEEDADKLRKNICEGQFTFLEPWWNKISDGAKNLVKRLLEVDPQKRYDVDDLLNDPWLNNYDCDVRGWSQDFFTLRHNTNNVGMFASPPYLDTLPERADLLHSAFSQSNNIQRLREGKRDFILGTGFIATPQEPLSAILQEEMFLPKNSHFLLDLKSSTLMKRRHKFDTVQEKSHLWPNCTQKQNNTGYSIANGNNFNPF